MDEDEIIKELNESRTPFVCFECGNEFVNVSKNREDEAIAVLKFDKGEPISRDSPEEPPSFYFICIDCYEKK